MRHAVTPNCFKTNRRALTRLRFIRKRLQKKLYRVRQLIRRTKSSVHPQRIQVNLRCTIIQKNTVLKTEIVRWEICHLHPVCIDLRRHVHRRHIVHRRQFLLPNHQNQEITHQVVTRTQVRTCLLSRFRNSARPIQAELSEFIDYIHPYITYIFHKIYLVRL